MPSQAAASKDVSTIVEKFLRWELAFINEGLAHINILKICKVLVYEKFSVPQKVLAYPVRMVPD